MHWPQFSMREILVEVALLGSILALSRLYYVELAFHDAWQRHSCSTALSALTGAFVGGLFRHVWLGGFIGGVCYLTRITIATIAMYPW